MYYGKKKVIMITVIIVVLVLILAIGGILAYFYTDLFKSNETLFYQYMAKGLDNISIPESNQLQDIISRKQNQPYEVNGELTLQYMPKEQTDQMQAIADAFAQVKIVVTGGSNPVEKINYRKLDMQLENTSIFEVEYANSNDIVALKSDEIVNAYVGVKNENLKVLAQKLGIQETQAIPNRIGENSTSIEELFSITEEEKKHMQETYMEVLKSNIAGDLYTKLQDMTIQKDGVDYVTTAYRLDLTGQDIKNVLIQLLQTLKEDSITLNWLTTKAKLLGLEEQYTQVNQFTNTIEKYIEQINNVDYAQNGLSIVVYTYQGETILTEIILENEAKLTLDFKKEQTDNAIVTFKIENLSSETDFSKIEMVYAINITEGQSLTQYELNIDDKSIYSLNTTIMGSADQNNVNIMTQISFSQDGETWTINYQEQQDFVDELDNIILLDNTNCAILNDYTTEQIQQLLTAITQRTIVVWNQKMQMIAMNFINTNSTMVQNGI